MPLAGAESAQAVQVDALTGQFFTTETKKDFHYDTAQHLIGTHAFGTGALGPVLVPQSNVSP